MNKLHFHKILLVFFGIFISGFAFSQDKMKLDSLNSVLKKAVKDTTITDIHIQIARVYGNSNPKSLEHYLLAQKHAEKVNDSHRIASTDGHLATYYYYTGQYHLAIYHTEKGVKIWEKLGETDSYMNGINNIAILFRRIGNLHKSLYYNQIQLDHYLKHKDSSNLAKVYNNMGNLYSDFGDKKMAMEYQRKGVVLRKKLKDMEGLASCYNNLALLYADNKDFDSAIYYYNKGLEIPEGKKSPSLYGAINNNMSISYQAMKNLDLAEFHILKSITWRDSVGDNHGSCQGRTNLADIYRQKGDYKSAKKLALSSLKLATEFNYSDELMLVYLQLAKINAATNNHKEAYEYMQKHLEIKDKLKNKDEILEVARIETAYKYDQKMLEDSLKSAQEKELLIKQQELESLEFEEQKKRQQVITWSGVGVGMALLFVVFVLLKSNKAKSRTNHLISQKNKEIEKQRETLQTKNNEVLDSINYAKRIQDAILPTNEDIKSYLPDHFLIFQPKDIISGDFYWLEKKNDLLYFAVADCTGHGVPGAIVSVICANALTKSVVEDELTEPGKILDRTRELIIHQFAKNNSNVQDGMDISLAALKQVNHEDTSFSLQFSGAHNPLWIIRKDALEIEVIEADKQPIGKYSNETNFHTHEVILNHGDTIYLFTDGFADQFGGEKGKKFKRANLKRLLLEIQDKTMIEQKEIIVLEFSKWKGHLEQIDDICILGIRL